MDLDLPLSRIVGGRTATEMERGLGLTTIADLLGHLPRRYAERAELTDLDALTEGDQVTVLAEVRSARSVPLSGRAGSSGRGGSTGGRGRPRSREDVVVTDGHAELHLVFFSQAYRLKELQPGVRGLFAGKVGSFRGVRQLAHPEYQLLGSPDDPREQDTVRAFTRALIPIYPATARLPSWRIAEAVGVVLEVLDGIPDLIPDDVRGRRGLCTRDEAIRLLHLPETMADVVRGRDRLRFEEAFVLQVELARRRADARALPARARVPRSDGVLAAFDRRLPFRLTQGQVAVGAELEADIAREHPMHRLLQGEVGSGKTVVSLRAMLAVVDAGGQAALLAPTEVLAQQHHRSVSAMLGPLGQVAMLTGSDVGTRVVLITGSSSASERRAALLSAASGEAGIVVGTHALLEERVQFADLGLVVVDEQHRFGVEQRSALSAKAPDGTRPHVLVMTATPIPRTVAMTVFGDLEVSTLTELPRGRQAIASYVVAAATRPDLFQRVWQRVREEVARGRQAFVVCPRIGEDADAGRALDDEETDTALLTPAQATGDASAASRGNATVPSAEDRGAAGGPDVVQGVLEVAERLRAGPLAGLRLEILHGRLPADHKDRIMRWFAAGDIDVLVATTVIEVGIDIPNAVMMVVLNADRFGVSQLHQLRGRVGRGHEAGLCLFVTFSPEDSPALNRLNAVAATTDGAALAELDLQTRREGDVLGAAQSGRRSSLRLLSVLRDAQVIADARAEASALVTADPGLAAYPRLAAQVADLLGADRGDFLQKA